MNQSSRHNHCLLQHHAGSYALPHISVPIARVNESTESVRHFSHSNASAMCHVQTSHLTFIKWLMAVAIFLYDIF